MSSSDPNRATVSIGEIRVKVRSIHPAGAVFPGVHRKFESLCGMNAALQ
ncbi:MAG TPA: hypothetical protein VK968_15095 [Roseimicrobium sp.]|nr:hypothetical protein [Roseimicrobium sp.]